MGRAHVGVSPCPVGSSERGQTTPYGGTLWQARQSLLRVPVGTGREVRVQRVAVLLPPDVGLRGSPGIAAQHSWLLSQQGEVGGPGSDGGRDCGRAWQ